MKYCSNCGSSKLEFKIPEHDNLKRYCCSDCGTIFYTNPNMVVGALCIRNKKILNDETNPRKIREKISQERIRLISREINKK